MRLGNDTLSSHPVHTQIRAIGPRVLHHKKGRGRCSVLAVIDKSDAWHAIVDCVVAWRIKQGPRLHATSLPAAQLAALNAREKALLAALGRGCLNREIAAELGLSLATVETYRKGIASKLGVSGKQLVRLAVLLRLQP